MKLTKQVFLIFFLFLSSVNNAESQETYILNYEDVDIKKVTQDIAQFSKKLLS